MDSKDIIYQILENDDQTEIEHVYHLSDIHIRNTQRHQEYKEVFERTYAELKKHIGNNIKKSLIVLTGDIVHSKTELSPEVVHIVNYFFKNLIDIAPVILIAGNHDCNLSNKNRMDALSPVVDDGENDDNHDIDKNPVIIKKGTCGNLYYIRKTGFYRFYNIVFGMTSMFDKMLLVADSLDDKIYNSIKQKNKFKIALYHGTIDKAQTDSGYKLNEQLNAGDFDGYDYVMLGDIHKYQYMNNENTIAYAGSLIQQSFGELIENHGFLKWYLLKNQTHHFDIYNDYGYCTIKILDGKMIDTYIPPKPRIRFVLDNTNQIQYQKIKSKIEKDYPVCEIVKEMSMRSQLLYGATSKYVYESKKGKNIDMMHIEKIEEYLKNMDKNDSFIESIISLHKKIYAKAIKNNGSDMCNAIKPSNNQSWEILELKFSNLLSYGENNVIDFTKFEHNQAIGIFAPNHFGKSAIIDILLYCLFGDYSRGSLQELMNRNMNNMSCSLKFKIGSKIYTIERQGKRPSVGVNIYKKNRKTTTTIGQTKSTVKFYCADINGLDKQDLTDRDKNVTNKKIREIVGEYNDYLLTCICLQKMGKNNFIDMDNANKKMYLQKILNIKIFKPCYLISGNKQKSLEGQKKALDNQIKNIKIDELDNKIINLKKDISESKCNLYQLNNVLSMIEDIEKPTIIKFNELDEFNLNSYADIINAIKLLDNKIKTSKNINSKILKQDIIELKKYLDKIDDEIINFRNEKDELLQQIINIQNKCNNIVAKINERKHIKKEIKLNKKQLSLLSCYNLSSDKLFEKMKNLKYQTKKMYKDIKKCKEPDLNKLEMLKEKSNNIQNIINRMDNISSKFEIINDDDKKYLCNVIDINKKFIEHLDGINNNLELCISNNISTSVKKNIVNIVNDNNNWINNTNKWIVDKNILIELNQDNKLNMKQLKKKLKKLLAEISEIEANIVIHDKNSIIQESIDSNNKCIEDLQDVINIRRSNELLGNKLEIINSAINQYYEHEKINENNEVIKGKIKIITDEIKKKSAIHKDIKNNIIDSENKINDSKNITKQQKKFRKQAHLLRIYQLIFMHYTFKCEQYDRRQNIKKNLMAEINIVSKKIDRLQYELDFSKKDKKKYYELKKVYDDIIIKLEIYQEYRKIIDYKKGLPCDMIKKCLKPLSDDVNKILSPFANFSIDITTADDNKFIKSKDDKLVGNIIIDICHHNQLPIGINLASGFERFIVGLAIRIALTQITMSVKPNFFIIDEGWSCMDSDNKNNISTVMNYIKELYDHVIIISHLDELKHQADYIINIEKDDANFSHVNNRSNIVPPKNITNKISRRANKQIIEI